MQQRQVQKILEFIEQLCPWFSEYGTLDAATWKEIGIKSHRHYYEYRSESISIDSLHFCVLIQERAWI